ncbi:mucin-5AC-like [Mya arenaria]|uniref:mucin-5AC-like n=1 Tax=Mya arenaria TaxID=6604 RepID=UPI0022E01400|nr:mucin-5AC-like [Mya arenaria]
MEAWSGGILLILAICLHTGSGLICLNCDAVANPRLCRHVTTCFTGEKCSVETFISHDGDLMYNLGCVDKNYCGIAQVAPPVGGNQFFSCHDCCDNHDLCNAFGCNSTGFPVQRGPLCFNCEAFPGGYPCHTIAHCESHEVCYNDATLEFQTDTLYSSGCRSKHHCADVHVDPITGFGRRAEALDGGRRSASICTDCCAGDLCNIQCQSSSACADDPSCQLLMQSYDVCKSPDIAKLFCQKSCNLCTGTSQSECQDARLDCSYIHTLVNMCSSKQQATVYGCLSFCGYCTGVTSAGPSAFTVTAPTVAVTTQPPYRPLLIGDSVLRGRDWNHGIQDGNGPGTVVALGLGTVTVTWLAGGTYVYRNGKDGAYEVRLSPIGTTISTTVAPLSQMHIGATVVRGPDWTNGMMDGNGPGTVLGVSNTSKTVQVFWNKTQTSGTFNVGNGINEVQLIFPGAGSGTTMSPSVLVPQIQVGTTVIRGTDWIYGKQDGGGQGTVVAVDPVQGTATVLWKNTGARHTYRNGKDGKYDILPQFPATTTPRPFTTSGFPVLRPGDKVVRGPDWTWGDQDSRGPGIVIDASRPGWAEVQWFYTNHTDSYRMGVNGAHDLQLYTGPWPPATYTTAYTIMPPTPQTITLPTKTTASIPTTTTTTPGPLTTTPRPTTTTTITTMPTTMLTRQTTTPFPTLVIGDRVERGPDWTWQKQDGNGPGEVTGFPVPGWVNVKWDKTGATETYRYGPDAHDVQKLKPTTTTSTAPPVTTATVPLVTTATTPPVTTATTPPVTTSTATTTYPASFVGMRVVRGPDWQWDNQDGNGPGTVTSIPQPGWVNVKWDNNPLENAYRYGTAGKYDVQPTASATTAGHIDVTVTGSTTSGARVLHVGDTVVRGPDWKWADQVEILFLFNIVYTIDINTNTFLLVSTIFNLLNMKNELIISLSGFIFNLNIPYIKYQIQICNRIHQDGNGPGTVTEVTVNPTRGYWIHVRWKAGYENDYRYGVDGFFDIQAQEQTSTAPTTAADPYAFSVGDVVVRGPNWSWGDQDGNSTGTVTSTATSGWVQVTWSANNYTNTYRNGLNGIHDVAPAQGNGLQQGFIQIGTRVVRGPAWHYGSQDEDRTGTRLVGTVVSVPAGIPPGWAEVEWSPGGYSNTYSAGIGGVWDIKKAP